MYYFFYGNTPALSRLELTALIDNHLVSISEQIDSVATKLDIPSLVVRLGGTRKVAQAICTCSTEDLITSLRTEIEKVSTKNIALTNYSSVKLPPAVIFDLKKSIKRPVRFVSLDTTEHELLMLSRQHVTEFNILPQTQSTVNLAKTIWIFDAKDWVKRDRNKPYRDIKRGMLPPKVARIMVNLALCGENGKSLYDPFCGTGTVLAEAALTGAIQLFGSDTNPDAISGSTGNLDWVKSSYELSTMNYQLLLADATHPPYPAVDCIATEPYMGPLLSDRNPLPLRKIQDIARGLDKLYRGALKAWYKLLPPHGRIVMTIPSFAVYARVIPTISVDTITSLGYNYILSVPYGKPGSTVIRNITILEKI